MRIEQRMHNPQMRREKIIYAQSSLAFGQGGDVRREKSGFHGVEERD